MKTVIMLVPPMGKTISQELKETVVNYVGLVNVDEDSTNDEEVPAVIFNGEMSKEQKQSLIDYLDTRFSRGDYAVIYVEYEEKLDDDNSDVLTFVFKK